MATLSSVKRLHKLCHAAVLQTGSTFDYPRVLEAMIALCNATDSLTDDMNALGENTCEVWWIGDGTEASLDAWIIAAFWHALAWQAPGNLEDRLGDAAGRIFRPGYTTGPEPESSESLLLDDLTALAEDWYAKH